MNMVGSFNWEAISNEMFKCVSHKNHAARFMNSLAEVNVPRGKRSAGSTLTELGSRELSRGPGCYNSRTLRVFKGKSRETKR